MQYNVLVLFLLFSDVIIAKTEIKILIGSQTVYSLILFVSILDFLWEKTS